VGRLATLYGSTVEAIVDANGLNQFAFIRVDQRLVIPVRLAAPATSTPTNTPAVVIVVTATPGAPPAPAENVYIVQPGDTMYAIAGRYNTTVAALAQLNGIVNPNIIQVGQRLIVPVPGGTQPPTPVPPPPTGAGPTPVLVTPTSGLPPATPVPPTAVPATTVYVVQPGDNLYRISLRFGVPMRTLVQANGIADPNRIYVGQRLIIP
jgi:LysM repeat protein